MKVNFLSLLIQAVLVSTITYTSLKNGIMLKQGDELISTLGYIKLVLKSCTLNLYQFNLNSQNYEPTNQKYQGRNSVPCSYLTIKNQNVVTENGTILFGLNSTDLVKVRLIIDDLANLRLIGEKNEPFSGVISYYQQLKISNYSQTKPLIRILESFQKISDNMQNPIINNKDWVFTVIQNQLIIRNKTNEISRSFSLPSAFFSQIGIFDTNNQTYPYTSFDGMRYSTVCQESKNELVGPFIIAVDGFWPVLRIYDQDGYILFEYTLNTNSQFYNPCPKGTFLFQDKCDLTCPASYTKQILNGRGSCRLSCEKGSFFDQINNMCVCKNRQISASQQYVCVNATSYQFGCFCQNNLFFDKSTRKCVQNCSKSQIAYKGLCLNCSPRCTICNIEPGYPYHVVCTNCQSGYTLSNGICVESNTNCTANCLTCLQGICITCLPFYSLLNNTCIQQCSSNTKLNVYSNLTSVCDSQLDFQSCAPSCQVCSNSNSSSCLVCKPGYYLILSLFMASCQRKSLLFSCLSTNYVNFNNIVCYNNQTNSLSTQNKCLSTVSNCLLCVYQSNDRCIVCQNGLILQQNKCVESCSQGFFMLNQACVPTISQCKINGFNNGQLNSNLFDLNIVTNNQFYNFLTSNGREQLNEPYGYQLFATKNYGLLNNYNPTNAVLFWSQAVCIQCNNGYGLSRDHKKCQPCPTGCLLCHYAYDGSCIATTISDVTLYTQGIDIKNCKTFLSSDFKCIFSCPDNTFPSMSPVYQQLICGSYTSSQSQANYLKIDGTTIQVSPSLYFHRLVFSAQLLNIPGIKNRLLQSGGSFDKNGTSFTVESNKPYFILNLQGEIQNYKSLGDTYPANSVYGINKNTSYSTYIKHSLAYVGYILSLLILMTHCIYVGNGYTYKMDNLIIFAQSIFYFLFIDIIISNPVSQYYYGWSWMHVNFYPNYFWSLLSPDQKTIPPYALYNIDANFIRNAGGSISLLLTFCILWLIVSGVCYYVEVKMKKWQIWYERIFKNSLTSMIQFCAFNIFYWAVAYFNYDFNSDSRDTKGSYTGFPVMFIIGIISYTLIRFYLDIIGPFWKRTNYFNVSSLYMIKRIVYASVIACSYQHKAYLIILIAFEIFFTIIRFYAIQRPSLLKERLIMWVQTFAIIFGTLILYVVKVAFIVAVLVTLVVYLWYLTFVIDLVDIYLISKNKVLKNSWLPCIEEHIEESQKQSSKDDFQQQQKTDRPFNQQVQK